jgi:hypothetical protein
MIEPYDPVRPFLAECVEPRLGARIQARDFYAAFVAWAARNGIDPMSEKAFGAALGGIYPRSHGHFRYYHDCRLKAREGARASREG